MSDNLDFLIWTYPFKGQNPKIYRFDLTYDAQGFSADHKVIYRPRDTDPPRIEFVYWQDESRPQVSVTLSENEFWTATNVINTCSARHLALPVDGAVKLWDLTRPDNDPIEISGQTMDPHYGCYDLTMSATGRYLANQDDRGEIEIWDLDLPTPSCLFLINGSPDPDAGIFKMYFSEDDRYLLTPHKHSITVRDFAYKSEVISKSEG